MCQKINPSARPVILPVRPHSAAVDQDCFPNVKKQILDHGGSLLHGWRILELPGFFNEDEFHGVWVAPDDSLLDVSPADENPIVFLPDSRISFGEQSFNRQDSIRLALNNHPRSKAQK